MMGERRIPHLRDIFGSHPGWECGTPVGGGGGGGGVFTDEEEARRIANSRQTQNNAKQSTKQGVKQEVKHLERHLSMKKTIRKKIMRELEQAWVEDPTEFKVEDVPREKLVAELRLESLSYGVRQKGSKSNSFLEFLRGQGGNKEKEEDSNRNAEMDDGKSTGFWKRLTTRRNKR